MNQVPSQATSKTAAPVSSTIRIEGPMNVANVSGLLMKLLSAFEHADIVTVDLSGVTEIDEAGLHLFCSAHRGSMFSGKEFKITGQERQEIWKAAPSNGCPRRPGCAFNREQGCIWTEWNSDSFAHHTRIGPENAETPENGFP